MLQSPPAPAIGLEDPRVSQVDAAHRLGVSLPTISRYMTAGIRGVKLPSVKLGGRRCTTEASIQWFFRAIQSLESEVSR